jgi:hypothetical protein
VLPCPIQDRIRTRSHVRTANIRAPVVLDRVHCHRQIRTLCQSTRRSDRGMSGCRTQRSEIMATIGARVAGAWPSVPAAFLSTNSERCSGRCGPADLGLPTLDRRPGCGRSANRRSPCGAGEATKAWRPRGLASAGRRETEGGEERRDLRDPAVRWSVGWSCRGRPGCGIGACVEIVQQSSSFCTCAMAAGLADCCVADPVEHERR